MKTFAKGTLFYLAMAVVGVVGQSCFDSDPKPVPNGLPKKATTKNKRSRSSKRRNINQQPPANETGIENEQTSMPATILSTLETTSSNVVEPSTDASQPSTPPQVYATNGDDLESNGEDLSPKGPNINQQPPAKETSIGKEQTSMPTTILSTVQKTSSDVGQPSTSPQVYATNGGHIESNGEDLSPKGLNINQQPQANETGIGKEQNLESNPEDVESESHKNDNYYANIVNTLSDFYKTADQLVTIFDSNPNPQKELKDVHSKAAPVHEKYVQDYSDLVELQNTSKDKNCIKQSPIMIKLAKCIDSGNVKQLTQDMKQAITANVP
ncbi:MULTISPECIES: hypothetical protein [unclassified Candidatus Cardinium]|uniref:hypothetical protein n=1 Tax=unclassified Candidatus Cardinium TaxID=2641185 RepID=UPI001FB28A7D|nr:MULTISPECIES: hypothetical protein [unclassified Candidatus Cardinium]